jgi:hypothetical protein
VPADEAAGQPAAASAESDGGNTAVILGGVAAVLALLALGVSASLRRR